jgi:rhodanese-related sulfurtransferase
MLNLLEKFNNYNIKLFLKHKIKFLIFVIVTLVGFISIPYLESLQEYASLKQKYSKNYMSGREAVKMLHEFDYIIDVRTNEEYEEAHVEESINVSHESILDDPEIIFRNHKITKDDKLFIYCESGNRASQVVEKLLESGFKKDNLYFTYDNVDKLESAGFVVEN